MKMMNPMTCKTLLFVGALSLLSACGGQDQKLSGDADGDAGNCDTPFAEAGASLTFPLGAAISLDGRGSRWCNTYKAHEVTFTWAFDRVPADSDVNDTALSENKSSTADRPNFIPDTPGEYVLSLRVSDPEAASDPDYVVVTISSEDLPPIADCGEDDFGTVGQTSRLNGSLSTDTEGARLAFSWGVSSVPACSTLTTANIYDQGTETPAIIPDCQGLFVMSLVVDDGLQWSDPDYCTIDVRSDNRAPVAEAGTGGSLPPCTSNPFSVSGWESFDPDGDHLSYAWSVVSAPSGADAEIYGFDDASLVAPQFTWDVPGEWTFQLQVSDALQTSSPDVVTYIVGTSDNNNSPTANAGGDQTAIVEALCTTSTYVIYDCDDCAISMHELNGTGSSDPDGDTLQYNWSETSDTLAFTGTTTAVTNVILPAAAAEYDVDLATEYSLQLDVNDCGMSDEDRITLTHICRGIYVEPELP
jgi:hypothetical protein